MKTGSIRVYFGSRIYLSLGSNLGEGEKNLREAVRQLEQFVKEMRVSSIYETMPLYVTEQPKYLNVVASGFTDLSPIRLLQESQRIEHEMGRRRNDQTRMGPRIIDVDILLYGERIIKKDNLVVPHPHMGKRQFVLIPLQELEPDVRDPVRGGGIRRNSQDTGRSGSLHLLGQGLYLSGLNDNVRD